MVGRAVPSAAEPQPKPGMATKEHKVRSAASRNQSGKSNRGIRETRGNEPHRLLLFRVFRAFRGLFPGVGLKNVAQIARLFRIALQRERKSVMIACSCDRPRLATRQTCAA